MTKTFNKEEYIKQKQEQIEELNQKLIDGVASVYEGENYKNYLKLSANFANYSVNNKLLVYLQNPEATLVKTYKAWKELERTVNKGEKAIHILVPNKYSVEITKLYSELSERELQYIVAREGDNCTLRIPKMGFKVLNVFDVSQTDGKELPPHNIVNMLSDGLINNEQYENLRESIITTITDVAKVSVEFKNKADDPILKNGANGYFRPSENLIVINKELSEAQQVKTLLHESAHSLLHGEEMKIDDISDTSRLSSRPDKECQAESVAFMVCSHLGIDSGDYSFGYVASWVGQDNEILLANLDIINKCANKLITEIDKTIENVMENSKTNSEIELD